MQPIAPVNYGQSLFGAYANQPHPRWADPATLHRLAGQSMGTHWSLSFDNPQMLALAQVRGAVEQALAQVVAQMSTWEAASDISRFNGAPASSWHTVPAEFFAVLKCALHWARVSGGAYDPTVGKLVALWGFGAQGAAPAARAPALPSALLTTHAQVGFTRIQIDSHGRRVWQPGGLALDFSGIAKGFAVDHAITALRALGLHSLLLEIGGELRACGQRPDGLPWRAAISTDTDEASDTPLVLRDMAVATSGNAWHSLEHQGLRYGHTIDPRTGAPASHGLQAVTVLHPECMQADALATALYVLGPDAGMAFAAEHQLAAHFALAQRALISPAFAALQSHFVSS